jgi:hypothetical protein
MQLLELLKGLDYVGSPNFLSATEGELENAVAYAHIFRRAAKERGLRGVYTLRPSSSSQTMPVIPVVYICDASSDEEADQTHRLVWNQDVVPFVIVQTPYTVRLYSGFCHRRHNDGTVDGQLRVLRSANEIAELVGDFSSDSIDSGAVWVKWAKEIRPEERVDRRLLNNLKTLEGRLRTEGHLSRHVSHSLIGKYVYLRYLRDRQILSDRKLGSWGLRRELVFGRGATLKAVQELTKRLDQWLNGDVFPLAFDGSDAPTEDQLQLVAGTFEGDELFTDGSVQLHLDFQAYNFAYIPIETLSVVYEQFLHSPSDTGARRGREVGAYYTPIPVVNFMLAQLEEINPLHEGMRVLDPSCGSGAFLVQCFRRLVESTFKQTQRKASLIELRDLLVHSIFGVDRDADACGVTELSLAITLLDYVEPPDLENDRRVRLPALRDKNIFHADLFAEGTPWDKLTTKVTFEWVVGNPPWKKLVPAKLAQNDRPIWEWMTEQDQRGTPVGDNQVAQAFAWKAGELLAENGAIAFLLPAMTLFEDPSQHFRSAFFSRFAVISVANFSNLAEVLFAGRSRVPAAAFLFRQRRGEVSVEVLQHEYVRTYSPLVANQESTRPVVEHSRNGTWSLVINASEVHDISLARIISGAGRPWKIAIWGSHLDESLLDRLQRQFPSLGEVERQKRLVASEGLQLRPIPDTKTIAPEKLDHVPEVVGKNRLKPKALERLRQIFVFPADAIEKIGPTLSYARRGRVELPLSVCRPPHVIVSAARHYAVYTDDYLVIPGRQIGLISPDGDKDFLKAVALFLSSDFAFYHQFLTSTQFGIKRDVATLEALRAIPLPVAKLSAQELAPWTRLHSRLVDATQQMFINGDSNLFSTRAVHGDAAKGQALLVDELNDFVSDALGLRGEERALIDDLLHVKLELNDGRLGPAAVSAPEPAQLRSYAKRLKAHLDGFIEGELERRHQVAIVYDSLSAMIQIDLCEIANGAEAILVVPASTEIDSELERTRRRLRKRWGQWIYFDRGCRMFEGTRTYLLKPMQRFHWTESQAVIDAGEVIVDTLEGSGAEVE